MARLEYNDPQAEAQFKDNDVKQRAIKDLADQMKVDNYTNGTQSARAGSEAQSIDEQVRRKR